MDFTPIIWILHFKILEFWGIKSKQSKILEDKIQDLKRQNVKFKHPKF